MIIDISKRDFLHIAKIPEFDLPKRWDGKDFYVTLSSLYQMYQSELASIISPLDLQEIKKTCDEILICIEYYHNGFPCEAYHQMEQIMERMKFISLAIYGKSSWTSLFTDRDPLMLYRIRNVQNDDNYQRKDIFHTPFALRSKIPTFRFSISGYPCLYLGTSLDLCLEEAKKRHFSEITIVSRFKLNRDMSINDGVEISVIELALKPKDFVKNVLRNENNNMIDFISHCRFFNEIDLESLVVMSSYLCWYPIIAASSFIRFNKQDPFASEYIVPQLLMQWVRKNSKENKLIGLRYFSCASTKASELGFNYVFPASGVADPLHNQYCRILAKSFTLTSPTYLHEFDSVRDCENFLRDSQDSDFKEI